MLLCSRCLRHMHTLSFNRHDGPLRWAFFYSPKAYEGFPGGSVVKNLPANAGYLSSIPGSGRSPEGGNGNPLQYSCLENPMDRGAWRAPVHAIKKSRTRLSDYTTTAKHTSPTEISWLAGGHTARALVSWQIPKSLLPSTQVMLCVMLGGQGEGTGEEAPDNLTWESHSGASTGKGHGWCSDGAQWASWFLHSKQLAYFRGNLEKEQDPVVLAPSMSFASLCLWKAVVEE